MVEKECIERELLIRDIESIPDDELLGNDNTTLVELPTILDIISSQPTSDTQSHGYWIKEYLSYGAVRYRCSVCNGLFSKDMVEFNHKNFCADCGTKMDKEWNDG